MVNENKYVYKGEKSSLILPILLMIAIVGVVGYFSILAGVGILSLYVLVFIIKFIKLKSFLRKVELIDKEENVEVYSIVKDLSDFFNISLPKIAIIDSEYVEVFALGLGKPYYLVVSSTALRFLNSKELTFAIGQELGNIHRGKVRILSLLAPNGNVGIIGNLLFGKWQKKVEAASDRLGLLMNADIDSAISVLIKACYEKADLRRLDIYNTLRAITSLKRSQLENLNNMLELDDYTIKRIINLIKYSRSKEYRSVVSTATYGLYSKEIKPIGDGNKIEEQENIIMEEKKEAKVVSNKMDMDKPSTSANKKESHLKEENIFENNNINGDETRVFSQNEINQIKNRNIKLSEEIIKKHSLEENVKRKEEPSALVFEKNIVSPQNNAFEKIDIMGSKDVNHHNYENEDEADELYELEASNTKKLIIVLSVLLVLLIGGMFGFKKIILTKTNPNNSNTTENKGENKGEEIASNDEEKVKKVAENIILALKDQKVDGVTYNDAVNEAIEDIKTLGEITNVEIKDKAIIGNIAYVRETLENSEGSKDIILFLSKAKEDWEVSYIVNDKNIELKLEEAYNQNYDGSSFNSSYDYKKQRGGFNEGIKTSQRVEGLERVDIYYTIEKFNDEWVEYVNTGDKDGISELVKEDSWISVWIDGYKRTGIKQRYLKHKINDIRKDNDYYYVWISEKIEENNQGNIDIPEYEWVYTIENVDGKFKILEYIRDPNVNQ